MFDEAATEARYLREAQLLQALAHPVRLAIFDLLADGPRCACEIEPHINLDQSTISRHLSTLRRAGVLKARKEGVRVIYELRDPQVLELRRAVTEIISKQMRQELALLTRGTGGEQSRWRR